MDHDGTATRSNQPCVGGAKAPPCPGHHDDLTVEADRFLNTFGYGDGLFTGA
jgi:hypothetical protein